MGWLAFTIVFLAVYAATLVAVGAVTSVLRRRAILDHPNDRSSHAMPTPRGGGIGILVVLLPAFALIALATRDAAAPVYAVLGAALMLAAVSFWDDVKGLTPGVRLAAQAAAVAFALVGFTDDALVFQGLLPPGLDRLAAGVAWIWFINLFNFMDGIDGIAGSETASIGAGLFAVAALVPGAFGTAHAIGLYGLILAAAAAAYLWWNWEPARVFLGDVGSVPLGFLLGWLLLSAAATGAWAVALILPLYYLADATITLVRRMIARERVWVAHTQHFYQRATRGGRRPGLRHGQVAGAVLAANAALIALAVAAASGRLFAALAGACVVVTVLLAFLGSRGVFAASRAGDTDSAG
ncbi:MAG: glycosyltransferase family 4 protein [Alphaproteobacteria bacterium]